MKKQLPTEVSPAFNAEDLLLFIRLQPKFTARQYTFFKHHKSINDLKLFKTVSSDLKLSLRQAIEQRYKPLSTCQVIQGFPTSAVQKMLRAGGHRGQLKSFTNLSKSSIIFTAADSSKGAKVYQVVRP